MSIPVLDAQAVLNAVDPGPYFVENGFFPKWYQDTNGMALELCLSPAVIAADAARGLTGGPGCTLLPNPGIFDPALPMVFPGNFPDESFWFMGDAGFAGANGINVAYGSNLEAAFAGGIPAPGDQIAFARIRIRIDLPPVTPSGTYTVIHPYGVEIFPGVGAGIEINATRDIGIGAAGVFTGALKGDIGPFLLDASVPTLGLIPGTDGVSQFVGDPNSLRPVVGSPFGTNFVRLIDPNGIVVAESNLFTVMGKVFPGTLPTPLVLERSTYSRTATTAQQDVFAKAPATGTVSFTDSAGNLTPMTDGDANTGWFGQSATNPALPATVTVTAANPASNNSASSATAPLVDLITITRAEYSAATGTLTVEAVSSDEAAPPALTANGVAMGGAGVIKSATLTGLTIPPTFVTVTSANGGSDKEDVVILP